MLLRDTHLLTKLEIWQPKYNTASGEWEVWPLVSKVSYASPIILIEFTKAKHLMEQRFCVRRDAVERCPRGTNGRSAVFKVPFSLLQSWETPAEVKQAAELAFDF